MDEFLPETPLAKPKRKKKRNIFKSGSFPAIFLMMLLLSFVFGVGGGFVFVNFYWQKQLPKIFEGLNIGTPIIKKETIVQNKYIPQTTEEEKIINTVKEASPAVVSIIITKDVPIIEKYYINPFGSDWPFEIQIPQYREKGTRKEKVGGGTGFIISSDGMVLTNKHVVSEEGAEYTIFTSNGEKYPAQILAKDPFYDLAVLKIDQSDIPIGQRKTFPTVKLGDSSKIQIGQKVIAIGYALGEFQNTVSVGVVSGLGRTITASGGGMVETLEDVIQTDAAINPGNSGGPLLNLAGEVIGINVAKAFSGDNIGFAIPINKAKKAIEQVKTMGKIVYPFLGVYYTIITPEMKEALGLPVDYGAWVGRNGRGEKTQTAVISGSPAAAVGLQRDDIILEFN
ncbi:trypsin-like peptidase domain-containing protein, partial [bacterium]|nr:trypsin-like peptidase domain-containing protein [bacterium]